MATEKDHLAQVTHNEKFLRTIGNEFSDWRAIVAFYVGVHLVEAFFATRQHHSHGHKERNHELKRRFPDIYKHFYPLYNYSVLVRYGCVPADPAHVNNELIGKRIPALRAALRKRRGYKRPRTTRP